MTFSQAGRLYGIVHDLDYFFILRSSAFFPTSFQAFLPPNVSPRDLCGQQITRQKIEVGHV